MRSIGSLTLDMNCADRAQPYPTPFPTAPNPLQPSTTPYNPPTRRQHYATPILPTHPTSVQYTPSPSSERTLSSKMSPFYPTLSAAHIHRSVRTKLLFVLLLSWQYASPGLIPPLSKKLCSSSSTPLMKTLCISFGALPAPGRQRCQPLGNTLVHHCFNHLHHLNHNILVHHLNTPRFNYHHPALTIFTILTTKLLALRHPRTV